MKRHLILSVLVGWFSPSGAHAESEAEKSISEAESRFFEAKSKIESDYRRDLAALLAKGDRIEVFLLDFEMEDTPSDFLFWDTRLEEDEFPIIPYGSKSKILKRSILTAGQRSDFLPALQKVVGIQGEIDGGALCHFPIHGVRVFSGNKVIFQTSFCWACNNFAIRYPDAPAWVGIRGGELFDAFNKIIPIPQSELERFDAKFGKKGSKPETKADQAAPSDGEKPAN